MSMRKAVAAAFVGLLGLFPLSALADYIAYNATIVGVMNTANQSVNFGIRLANSGSGPCINQIIQFFPANAPSVEEYKRAFSLASVAYLQGKRVDVWSFSTLNCSNGAFIEIHD